MGSVEGPPLNATGKAQATDIGAALRAEPVVHLYTSPARRARETAEIVAQFIEAPLCEINDLCEINVGRLEGLTRAEVQQKFGSYYLDWERDAAVARPPGGETVLELQERAWEAVQRLSDRHSDETVVVVSHLFTILAVVAKVLEMPLKHFLRLRLDPGAMVRIELGHDEAEVISANESWHLRIRRRDEWATANDLDKPVDASSHLP